LGVEDDRFFFSEEDDRCVTKTLLTACVCMCMPTHIHPTFINSHLCKHTNTQVRCNRAAGYVRGRR
jgi:hypothetical protein